MAYSGRHRYKSRREKFQRTYRITKVTIFFVIIGGIILLYKNWQEVYTWWIIHFG